MEDAIRARCPETQRESFTRAHRYDRADIEMFVKLEVWNQLRRNAAAFYSSDRSLRQPLQRPGKNVPSEVLRGPKTAAVTSTTQTPGGSTGADQERITVERNTLSLIAEETPPVEFRKESEVVDLTQIGNTLAARNRASFWSSLPAQAFTRASSFAATTPRISAEEESDYDSDYDPNESRRPVTRLNRPSKRLKTKQETPNHITPPPLTPPLAQSPIRRTFKAPLSLPSSPPERQLDAISNRSEHQAEPVGLIGLLKTQLGAIMKHNSTMSRNQEAILQQLLELNRRQGEANLALKEVVAALKG